MDITIQPTKLRGSVTVPPSKSMAHRMLICAALADNPTQIICPDSSQDNRATVDCLRALGAQIITTENGFSVYPIQQLPQNVRMNCGESGSTLRFLLPIVGALGVDATFLMEGRLPHRPLSPLWEEMERMGCSLSRPATDAIRCTGKLRPGRYTMDGSVSSQFISGLLFALSLLPGSTLDILGEAESKPYIHMTRSVMDAFRAPDFHSPGRIHVEGDWSNGAFWLAAECLDNEGLLISNLDLDSIQGDRAAVDLLYQLSGGCPTISASDNPDLIPVLSVVAAAKFGAVFTDICRLRLKESDRVAAIVAMINGLGGKAVATENTITVFGTGLTGGVVDSFSDHRIAMSAAIAATICKEPVTITQAHCVNKSYPSFWETYHALGGNYDQHLR